MIYTTSKLPDGQEPCWRMTVWRKSGTKEYYIVDDDHGDYYPDESGWKIVDGPFPTAREAMVRYLVRAHAEGWAL